MKGGKNADPRVPVNQDHVATEYAFKRLLGQYHPVAADYFRQNQVRPNEIGKLLKETSEELSERMNKLDFKQGDYEHGGTAIVMKIAISELYEMGERIEKLDELDEKDNYHWEIIGRLINIITTLFEYIEGKNNLQK